MITDPIANFVTKIRNCSAAQKETVEDSYSKLKFAVAQLMQKRGFLTDAQVKKVGTHMKIFVSLNSEKSHMHIRRVSKPGQRIYVGFKEMRRVKNGLGFGVYSTSKGILSDKEAREQKIGGEYLCEIY